LQYIKRYLSEVQSIASKLDVEKIDRMADIIVEVRKNAGRLFFLGVGGSAANASHAVNDFRKIAGIEAYTPADNVGELTARTNDNGWDTIFVDWLCGSKLTKNDVIFVLSVGGGNVEKNVSSNIVKAIQYSKKIGAKIVGILGRDGGYTATIADACVVVPTVSADTVTAHAESFQPVVWHLIVSHPKIKQNEMKWESIK